jgi:hypothetical protein
MTLPVVLSLLSAGGVAGTALALWSTARILAHRVVGDLGADRATEVIIQVKYSDGRREALTVSHPDTQQAREALNELRHAGTV